MRYDKQVIGYISDNSNKYNPKLGRYEEFKNDKYIYYANISNSLERNKELFGEIDSDIVTVRIQGKIQAVPSFFIIDNKKYSLIKKTQYKHDTTFYVREQK
ncbi:hypothetical protein [Helcococcus bovis]|uniref:hypothetical protein n=1 Tax=Helcococcus bovis TaxID=3153252 RepID=UPI0038B9BC92